MPVPIYQVDAFTDKAFAGNPAGVCLLEKALADGLMQSVAMEMNLSETAFVWPEKEALRLRWFTPLAEVNLCGHATLATAKVLFETGRLKKTETARFDTRSGRLEARLKDDWIELDFPSQRVEPCPPPAKLLESLKAEPLFVGRNREDYLLEVVDEETVRGLRPDFALLRQATVRGVMVTSRSTAKNFDFVSRFFAPAVGIDEDPVTGSAHCALAPYWGGKLDKKEMVGFQVSWRGGVVRVRLENDRVKLAGQAVIVFSGQLDI